MSRIILICGLFPVYRRGIKIGEEYVASHGVDEDTGKGVIVSNDRPTKLGAKRDPNTGEWVIEDER